MIPNRVRTARKLVGRVVVVRVSDASIKSTTIFSVVEEALLGANGVGVVFDLRSASGERVGRGEAPWGRGRHLQAVIVVQRHVGVAAPALHAEGGVGEVAHVRRGVEDRSWTTFELNGGVAAVSGAYAPVENSTVPLVGVEALVVAGVLGVVGELPGISDGRNIWKN